MMSAVLPRLDSASLPGFSRGDQSTMSLVEQDGITTFPSSSWSFLPATGGRFEKSVGAMDIQGARIGEIRRV